MGKTTANGSTWMEWNPGLDNDHKLLGDIYKTLPTYEFSAYPLIVRIVENPKSPLALPGACKLIRHDLIHILLGRGLLVQDEAFVIGYTMGSSRKISIISKEIFKLLASYAYPQQYRFKKVHHKVYDLAYMIAQEEKNELYKVNLESMMNVKIGTVRERYNINTNKLRHAYLLERSLLPDKNASKRLPPPCLSQENL